MDETIRHLDDATAIQLVSAIAQPYARTGDLETQWTPELRQSYGVGTLLLGVTAALVVLQTRFEVERDKDGKVTWKIGKEAADSSVLKTLIEKVLSFPLGK